MVKHFDEESYAKLTGVTENCGKTTDYYNFGVQIDFDGMEPINCNVSDEEAEEYFDNENEITNG